MEETCKERGAEHVDTKHAICSPSVKRARLSDKENDASFDDSQWPGAVSTKVMNSPLVPVPAASTATDADAATAAENQLFGTARSPIVLDSPEPRAFLADSPLPLKKDAAMPADTSVPDPPLIDIADSAAAQPVSTPSAAAAQESIADVCENTAVDVRDHVAIAAASDEGKPTEPASEADAVPVEQAAPLALSAHAPPPQSPDDADKESVDASIEATEDTPKAASPVAVDQVEAVAPLTSKADARPGHHILTPARKDHSDWMLQFETPLASRTNLSEQLTARRSRLGRPTPKAAILDLSFEFATPRSVPTYSERDVELIRQKAEAEAEAQIAKVRHELDEYQKALSKEAKSKQQMEAIMNEFETTMSKMIDDAKQERANYSTNMAIITEERDLLQDHVAKVEQAFEELKKRYDMRKAENEKLQKVSRNAA
ncbi:hypothetical protein SYNPS1DRAFT_26064 [Syncephalis pseudoplumigaleata]|uniref:Transforming acidic coiled-coil-containing protein C-terminal domain-containing protein n=1 Tax=Syncephalis pseudoplumigaleata TaxID=1712513 RepID=A0A4P9YRA7_9FUNG|nr:hypothetical protein SYNPS1DRAFT_26064 [Syncephalis pseudoplumigaleata]|eukprot:RKP22264.1 hypothetical protein SYNPS1DRAFT_26064 [Syncephalis pseudoplumigaleata]